MCFLSKVLSACLAALAVVNAGEILSYGDDKDIIPGSYIIVMKDGVSDQDFTTHRNWAANVHASSITRRSESGLGRTFNFNGWKAYSGNFDDTTIQSIANDSAVKYVEPDRIMRALELVTQSNVPSWGLARISSNSPGATDYVYDSTAGEGVVVYGVDTGIDIDHADFEGRAEWGTNTVDNDDTDGNGHGTHTASTIAGKEYGVAKKASLVSVKVLDSNGSGSMSGVISGIEWSVNDAKSKGALGKAVMNLSLGGGFSQSLNDAATNAVQAGIFLAVAAGNGGTDASNNSPASAENVCTVGASTSRDGASRFSNYGSVIDLYAPGDGITAAVPGGGSKSLSGTSMAAPHVAGVAAYLIALEGISTGEACARITQLATSSIINPGPNTTEKLLFNGVNA
ncbi:hypothetical protein VTO42DRAFT_1365 [Malbranchea cinnamomea]